MTPVHLMVLRHAPTPWNRAHRIQGRSDVALDDHGRAEAASWVLSAEERARVWFTSPLRRCVETAEALGLSPVPEPALIEMDWGAWDGLSLSELRGNAARGMAEREARGLDFRPEGGESPSDVCRRLAPFLDRVRAGGRDAGCVCHKGVMRALVALACGWDMTTKCPVRIETGRALRFVLDADGISMETPP